MDEDTIKLGMELGIDIGDANIVEKLLKKIKEMDNYIQKSTSAVTNFNGELGKLNRMVTTYGKEMDSVNEYWEQQVGVIKEVTYQIDKQGNVINQKLVGETKNFVQQEKEAAKQQEALNRGLEQANKLRQRESDIAYKTSLQIARTEEKALRANSMANGSAFPQLEAKNTMFATLLAGNYKKQGLDLANAAKGDMFDIGDQSLRKYLSTLGKVLTIREDIGNAESGWKKYFVDITNGSNEARNMVVKLNDAEKKMIVDENVKTSGLLDKKNAMLGWAEAINTAFKRMVQWTVAGTAIFGTIRLLREGFQTLKEMETESANIMKVLNGKDNTEIKKQGSFLDENAIKLAKQYGQSVMEVQRSMGVWARQYKDVHAIVNMTNASLLAATATDISFESSVKDLSAILAEWGMRTEDATHCVNVLNQESNSYRITAQGLADALTKTSAAAKASGMTFEELSGIITTGMQVLGVEGNQMGTILTRIFGRLRGNKEAKEALEGMGIDIAQPLNKILTQLAAKWDTLSKGQKQSLAIIIAGNQHWNRFIGIMDNWKTVVEATTRAYFSHNSALNEIQIMMNTTQKRVAQVSAAWQQFIHQNEAVLGATQGLVYVLGAIVNGASQVPPVVLGIGVALVGLIPVVVKIISLLREMTILELISKMLVNWKAGLVLAIAGVATYLFAMGKNAQDAAWKLQGLQSEQERLKASMEGLSNNVRGILYLKDQYAALRDEMAKLNPQSKEYISVSEKMEFVSNELAKAIANGNTEQERLLRNAKNLLKFSDDRVQALVNEINAENMKTYYAQQSELLIRKARLGNHIDTLEEFRKEYNTYMHYEDRKAKYEKQKEAAGKNWWAKLWNGYMEWWDMAPAGQHSENFPGHEKYSRFDNPEYTAQLKSINEQLVRLGNAGHLPKLLTVEDIMDKSTRGDYTPGKFGDDKSKKDKDKVSSFYTDLTRSQIEQMNKLASYLDSFHGLEQDTYKVMFKNGEKDFTLKTSSETKSLLESIIQEWESYGKTVKAVLDDVGKAMSDAGIAMAQSASNAAKEWDDIIGKMKNIPDTLKDTLGVGDFYSKRQKEYSDIYNALDQQKTSIANQIAETQERIEANNKVIYSRDSSQASREVAMANVENYTKVLQDLMGKWWPLLSQMSQVSAGASYYGQQGEQWKQIMGVNSEAMQRAFDNVLNTQKTYSNAEQQAQMGGKTFKGSSQEWILGQMQYQSQLDYVQSIKDTITLTKQQFDVTNATSESTKQYNARIKELDNQLLEESKKLGQHPVLPQDELSAIQDKYKPATDAFQKTMEQYGYTFDDLGISTRKELHNLQSSLSDYINFLGRADDIIANLTAILGNPYADKAQKEWAKAQIDVWNQSKDKALGFMNDVDGQIEQLQKDMEKARIRETIYDAFKAILKGTKSFKEAIADMSNELRGNAIDKFMDNFTKKFNEITDFNDSSGFKDTVKNIFQSFAETWKEMDKNQKFQLAMAAGSLFIKNNGSRQSMQDQGIMNGASQGFAMGGPWGAVIGGVLGFAMGDSQYKKQKKQNNADLRTSIMDSMTSDSYQAYMDFLSAGQSGFGRTKTTHTLAGITSITGTDKTKTIKTSTEDVIKKWQDLYANGGIQDLINSSNTALLQTLEKWSKFLDSLGSSVSNVASSLENAFQSDNYYGFLQNWGQSLEDMTRTALIRGFLAQGPLQTAYQNLSNTIGMAVLDGVLSGEEIASIKKQGNEIASQMKVLYQSLALVDNMYPSTNGSSGSEQTYTAGSSTPITYNNYITIEAGIFWGDKDQARQAALEIRDLIQAEESRG